MKGSANTRVTKPDGVNILIYTIIGHFLGTTMIQHDRSYEQFVKLKMLYLI